MFLNWYLRLLALHAPLSVTLSLITLSLAGHLCFYRTLSGERLFFLGPCEAERTLWSAVRLPSPHRRLKTRGHHRGSLDFGTTCSRSTGQINLPRLWNHFWNSHLRIWFLGLGYSFFLFYLHLMSYLYGCSVLRLYSFCAFFPSVISFVFNPQKVLWMYKATTATATTNSLGIG